MVPDSANARLVTAVPEQSFFGKAHGFTPRQFSLLRLRSTSYAALGGYAVRWQAVQEPGGVSKPRRIAIADPAVFSIFGLPQGQAYVAEQLASGPAAGVRIKHGLTSGSRNPQPRSMRPWWLFSSRA
jgi:hypothetical protein